MNAVDFKVLRFDPDEQNVVTGIWDKRSGSRILRVSCVPARMTFVECIRVTGTVLRHLWFGA